MVGPVTIGAATIRAATHGDRPQLRRAVVELQEYERRLHATRLPGEQMADAYLDWMQSAADASGAVLVAEIDGAFAGFAAGWIEHVGAIAETSDSTRFGLISDVCVMPEFRGGGLAARLIDEMGRCLGRAGVTRLRVNALAANASARRSYEHAGFTEYEVSYEKSIGARENE
jgi:GNAT superfamily N-acetyltransferase